MKATIIDENLIIKNHVNINYDQDLPQFNTHGGVLVPNSADPNLVIAPVRMWLMAIELAMSRLMSENLQLDKIVCVSGCAQQHGTVWWREGSSSRIASMNPAKSIHEELNSSFSLSNSPTWLDSSTERECEFIETFLSEHGYDISKVTGSQAERRFAGPQILKIFKERRDIYEKTERITLISNFMSSILVGNFAPFDVTDAAGTNMMDIRTKSWSDICLIAIVNNETNQLEGLRRRLGSIESENIVDSHTIIGKISDYCSNRFGFSKNCLVSSFPGDTLSSMAGLCVSKSEFLLSLGTSDTACFWMNEPKTRPNVHLSRCPFEPESYVAMTGFKNGSKTRERIRDEHARGDWEVFNRLLESTPGGNDGNLGFYFDLCEIYPPIQGCYRFNSKGEPVDEFCSGNEVRACIEGQFMRLHKHLEVDNMIMQRVLVTGGASKNKSILQVLADIFQLPIRALNVTDSACLGAAYLAKYAHAIFKGSSQIGCFNELITQKISKNNNNLDVAWPDESKADSYRRLMERYTKLEDSLHRSHDLVYVIKT